MSERISVFDNDGTPLATMRANVTRSWVLNGMGEATFDISYMDINATRRNLEFGNLLLVEHSSLPPWVGVIDTPRSWKRNTVSVKAYDASKLWAYRRTSGEVVYGTSGAIFRTLIKMGNRNGDTRIRPGDIYSDGIVREETMTDTIDKHVKKLAERTGSEYRLRPWLDASRNLVISAEWRKSLGKNMVGVLTEGQNVESSDNMLTEDGTIINDIQGIADASNGKKIKIVQRDLGSISRFGVRQASKTFSGNLTDTTLKQSAIAELKRTAYAVRSLRLRALDEGGLFSLLDLGNTFGVNLFSVGFFGSGRGYTATVRIMGMKYTSNLNVVELVVSEVTE